MITISVTGMKGGVGKTTTAANLAAGLAARGSRVLMIDLDGQGGLAHYFGVSFDGSTFDILTRPCPLSTVTVQVRPCLDLLPADHRLYGLDAAILGRPDRQQILANVLGRERRWSHVIIDTPPSLGLATANALQASDWLILPVPLDGLSIEAFADYRTLLAAEILRAGLRARVGAVVPTFFEARTRLRRTAYSKLQLMVGSLLTTPIHASVKVAEAQVAGMSVIEHAPRSQVARDYAALVEEVARWLPAR